MSASAASRFLIMLLTLTAAAQPPLPPASQSKFIIAGTVIDSVHGNPLPKIEITLFQKQSLLQSATTDDNGRFEFSGLGAGKYGLDARGNGYLPQGYEQHGPYITAIVAGPGIETGNLVFRLKPESLISGTISDEFNEPVQGADVYLFTAGVDYAHSAVLPRGKYETSDVGGFYFNGLREGKYYLVAVAKPWYARKEDGEASSSDSSSRDSEENPGRSAEERQELDLAFPTTYYTNTPDPDQATPIFLKPGEHATVEFHLTTVRAIRLKVQGVPGFDNATAPLRLSEQIFGQSRLVTSRNITRDGTELMGLAPGHYVLEFPAQGAGDAEQQPLDLIADTETAPGQGRKLASSLSGAVQLEREGLCMRCRVLLVHLPSYQLFQAQSGPKGFEIGGGVRSGRYVVLVDKAENYFIKTITAAGGVVKGTELEIPAGHEVRVTIVMTKDVGTVAGIATLDGKPASAVAIYLVPDNPEDNLERFRGDQSDSDGSFEIRAVPGPYTLIAIAEGWDMDTTNPDAYRSYLAKGVKVQLRAGERAQFNLNVQSNAGLSK